MNESEWRDITTIEQDSMGYQVQINYAGKYRHRMRIKRMDIVKGRYELVSRWFSGDISKEMRNAIKRVEQLLNDPD